MAHQGGPLELIDEPRSASALDLVNGQSNSARPPNQSGREIALLWMTR